MVEPDRARGLRYKAAGVDIAAADEAVSRMKQLAATASRPEVLAGIGPFSGLFELKGYKNPVLASSADGVGTKLRIARAMDRHHTIGVDLVNHCVNDILTSGAEPLFFLDYYATANLAPDQAVEVVKGVADACRAVGCALVGGENAELPGIYRPGDYDLAGFIVGVVERDQIIDGRAIESGDVLLGLASSGLHTNGYSLVRRVFGVGVDPDGADVESGALEAFYPSLGRTLGDELLEVHRCYWPMLKPALPYIQGMAHITGGGVVGNVPRILPSGLAARLDAGSWQIPPIFQLIQEHGNIDEDEMYRTFNMGLGMVIVCKPDQVAAILSILPEARPVGQVIEQRGGDGVILT